ncbi:hypothetical protein AVEN_194896-1 [Araneus ventricosus]|uniref:Granulins domain-containing protein n=1 Tax=Araneus ventricosus TaxID=182803 RepID=A0A4Y2B2U0_ARAVE|nr:hypothetical protein AVEN_194896-1 [Araneus ventricosus]
MTFLPNKKEKSKEIWIFFFETKPVYRSDCNPRFQISLIVSFNEDHFSGVSIIMIYFLTIALVSSSLVSASGLTCQDSNVCNKGSKRCEDPLGEQWCCKEKTMICDENSQCSFLVPLLPFIQLRPGATESELGHMPEDDKMFYNKYSSRKSKYTLNNLLNYHCESLASDKAAKINTPNLKTNGTDINCPGRKQRCPPSNTCCLIGKEQYGCCRYSNAVCCSDLIHCCPIDTVCNTETMQCTTKYTSRKMELLR